MPPTRSQERRWTRAIRPRLAEWVRDTAGPLVQEELERAGFPARIRAEAERLYIGYEPLFEPRGIVRPEVQVDFGARSTGEPNAVHPVVCDAAAHVPGLTFPEATPVAMLPERTFWEKATSMHVYCLQGRVRGERWSRHWHDLVRLDDAGIAARALADHELALAVARHKAMFFRENDSDRQRIDYRSAVSVLRGHPATDAPVRETGSCCRLLLDDTESGLSGNPEPPHSPSPVERRYRLVDERSSRGRSRGVNRLTDGTRSASLPAARPQRVGHRYSLFLQQGARFTMKALISSTTIRLAGLALLVGALLVPPIEAATPECEEFAGCQLCENDNCEIIICDDSVNMECNF